ncbi:autotransporter outer membrane beta-barrel domain-containing protein [Rhizobium tropici]|uniref:autotransporter outer membrane beta-barrel domain-containing protein n=1 Tax=Rhizobium tropici TaxID=398 RepID=UPI0015EBF52D|nr:autotransporter outer membrane beta-barrel domain-containing protein [Rhizobium tropici]
MALLSSIALTCLGLDTSLAQTVGNYTPTGNSNQVGAQNFGDGATHMIGGGYQTITGSASDWDYPALIELENQGRLLAVDGTAGGSVVGKVVLATGGRVLNTSYRDPITGAAQNVSVFNSNNFDATDFSVRGNSTSAKTWTLGGDQGYYLDGRIATVTNGSTLNVVVGDPTAEPKAVPGNTLTMFSKQTSVYRAEGAAGGTINYNSNTWFDLGTSEGDKPGPEVDPTTGQATGTFSETKFDRGVTFPASTWINPATGATETIPGGTVTDLATFKNYNNYLIGRLQAGALNINNYATQLQSAYRTTTFTATYQAAPDQVTAPTLWASLGQRALVAVDGANSVVNFGVDSKVKDGTLISSHHIAYATGGATVNNEGKLSAGTNGGSNGFAGDGLILADSGSKVFNHATGSISNYDPGTYQPNSTAGLTGVNNSVAIMLYGNGTSFQNDGIVNVAGGGNSQNNGFQAGIYLKNGAPTATNNGVINVAVNGNLSDTSVYGVGLEGRSTFTNDGEIHIGRTGQYSLTDPTTDVSNNLAHIYGIGGGGGSQMVNNGLITIGSLTGGASAMRMANGDAASVAANTGTITINGAVTTTPLQNIGMELRNAGGTNSNSGTINLNGVNAVGIHLLSGSLNTSVASTGVINVGGGVDPATGTRNFGVWAEGDSGKTSTANIDGQINLTGVGGIGVHARGMSEVNVAATAVPNFISGSDQIGFFIYGPDAVVNTAATAMDVATARSTLFRVADGADYDASGTTITVSGTDAVGIVGTGATTDVHTQDGTFNLTGDGATAVVIEGGATATILPVTNINLNGPNTVAGIVDGQKHDLFGALVGAPDPTTLITNAADIGSNQAGVTAFIARNSGTLDTAGDITLAGANSTGILAQDGGNVRIDGAQIAVNGWATRASGGADSFDLDGATVAGSDGLFEATSNADATFEANASTLTGRVLTQPGSTSDVTLTGSTLWTMDADSNVTNLLNNGSTIAFASPIAGSFKTLLVNENLVGENGTFVLNTYLGTDNSPSDLIHVEGDTTGTNKLRIVNAGGPGAQTTSDGIKVVQVDGSSNGQFSLLGDYVIKGQQAVIGGAYAYTLWHNGVANPADGNWYLRSQLANPVIGPVDPANPANPVDPVNPADPGGPIYQPGVPLYEAYPQVLLGLNGLPTLQQRVGNRYWIERPAPSQTVFCKDPTQNFRCPVTAEQAEFYADGKPRPTIEENGVWGVIEGSYAELQPHVTTSGTNYDLTTWKMRAGIDGLISESDRGKLIAGFTVHYGHASADVASFFGPGSISTDGYGLGATATWYGSNGFYLDAQGQLSWYNSNLSSDWIGNLANGSDGFGYALSLEGGQRVGLGENWTIIPQAQLVYSNVRFDAFTDPSGADVSLDHADSLRGRLGLAFEYQNSWKSEGGQIDRAALYGISNLHYEFLEGTRVNVSQIRFTSENDPLWGEIGFGGSYNWNDDKYSLYGELSASTSLQNFGDSYSLNGKAGLRVKW